MRPSLHMHCGLIVIGMIVSGVGVLGSFLSRGDNRADRDDSDSQEGAVDSQIHGVTFFQEGLRIVLRLRLLVQLGKVFFGVSEQFIFASIAAYPDALTVHFDFFRFPHRAEHFAADRTEVLFHGRLAIFF